MADEFRKVPRPDYSYDVDRLIKTYEKSLASIQDELNSLFLSDFERAQIIAVEDNIARILKDLRTYSGEWAKTSINRAAKEGTASTIYSLGIVETYDEALKVAKFNGLNKRLVDAVIADTQADLLAVTENVSRRTRSTIRKTSAEVLRAKTASGINGTQSLTGAITKGLREKLKASADNAIVDAAGRRWKLRTYAEMLARTKMMEAHLEASINEAIDENVMYGVISNHGATDACKDWEDKIIALVPDAPGDYPYIGDLPRNDIFHPNCKHVVSPIRRLDRLPEYLRKLNNIAA